MAQTEMKTNKTKRDKESGQKYYNYERIKNEKRNRQKAKTLKFQATHTFYIALILLSCTHVCCMTILLYILIYIESDELKWVVCSC